MSKENPTWGAPRIQSELALLGHDLAESTVAKYMFRTAKPPSQTWRTFLDNHVGDLVGIDFFTVPTATFRVLYCFIILGHARRRLIHFNVTTNPTAQWTARQITEAFPWDEAPEYLSVIVTVATEPNSEIVWRRWALRKFPRHPDHPGRIRTANA
jgi:hypothetical protein